MDAADKLHTERMLLTLHIIHDGCRPFTCSSSVSMDFTVNRFIADLEIHHVNRIEFDSLYLPVFARDLAPFAERFHKLALLSEVFWV